MDLDNRLHVIEIGTQRYRSSPTQVHAYQFRLEDTHQLGIRRLHRRLDPMSPSQRLQVQYLMTRVVRIGDTRLTRQGHDLFAAMHCNRYTRGGGRDRTGRRCLRYRIGARIEIRETVFAVGVRHGRHRFDRPIPVHVTGQRDRHIGPTIVDCRIVLAVCVHVLVLDAVNRTGH